MDSEQNARRRGIRPVGSKHSCTVATHSVEQSAKRSASASGVAGGWPAGIKYPLNPRAQREAERLRAGGGPVG
ncbi:hypothetical protein, partial [Microbacterium trichothecenolyticum]|uniref:hypothetical protein n=1 Tax=Microbacterium trichothecenolyticum TaxID=69370 RepID=UPI001B80032F